MGPLRPLRWYRGDLCNRGSDYGLFAEPYSLRSDLALLPTFPCGWGTALTIARALMLTAATISAPLCTISTHLCTTSANYPLLSLPRPCASAGRQGPVQCIPQR